MDTNGDNAHHEDDTNEEASGQAIEEVQDKQEGHEPAPAEESGRALDRQAPEQSSEDPKSTSTGLVMAVSGFVSLLAGLL